VADVYSEHYFRAEQFRERRLGFFWDNRDWHKSAERPRSRSAIRLAAQARISVFWQRRRPVISGCSGCSLDATASDAAGTLTEGTSQTGFVLTFEVAFATAPHCVVSSPTGHAFTSYTATTTTLTVANGVQTGSKYSYVCLQ